MSRPRLLQPLIPPTPGVAVLSLALLLPASSEEEMEPHAFRILPLGDLPPFRQEVRDGVRYELDPPEGSVPPTKVEVDTTEDAGVPGDGKLLPLRLRLNSASPLRRVGVGEKRRIPLVTEDGGKWAALPLASGQRSLRHPDPGGSSVTSRYGKTG